MANQNLSEFGEKLFVADADHTFIWDTAASISKRVSRNSWLNSGTLTSDAPVTISQTWNNAAVAFTGLKFNAAGTSGTNSAAASLLVDFRVNEVTQFSVTKAGRTKVGNIIDIGSSLLSWENPYLRTYSPFSCARLDVGAVGTVLLEWDAANTLALRNGAAAQTFNVYGTSSASNANYARLALTCGLDGNATILTQALGTGTAGTVSINGVPVGLGKGNVAGNVAVGVGTLATNTGTGNVAVGTDALPVQVAGNYNTAVGRVAMWKNINGGYNTAIGNGALYANLGGANNVAVGESALANSLGSFNIGLGMEAGANAVVGQNTNVTSSIFLGFRTKSLTNGESNQIVIGHEAVGIGSNSVVLGNDSITKTALKGNVGIGTTSPTSKLQVTNGDVEIETVTSGIIMKAAGTSTRYRITLNAGGTALVFTAI